MSWDLVMALAQAELGAYMPRLSSGGLFAGLVVVTVTLLVGFNAPIAAAIAGLSAIGWALVFALRGTKREG